jgi:hypothetical protein
MIKAVRRAVIALVVIGALIVSGSILWNRIWPEGSVVEIKIVRPSTVLDGSRQVVPIEVQSLDLPVDANLDVFLNGHGVSRFRVPPHSPVGNLSANEVMEPGYNDIRIEVRSMDGKLLAQGSQSYLCMKSPPDRPLVTEGISPFLNSNFLKIKGTAEPGADVTAVFPDFTYSSTAVQNGQFEIDLNRQLKPGKVNFNLVAKNPTTNAESAPLPIEFQYSPERVIPGKSATQSSLTLVISRETITAKLTFRDLGSLGDVRTFLEDFKDTMTTSSSASISGSTEVVFLDQHLRGATIYKVPMSDIFETSLPDFEVSDRGVMVSFTATLPNRQSMTYLDVGFDPQNNGSSPPNTVQIEFKGVTPIRLSPAPTSFSKGVAIWADGTSIFNLGADYLRAPLPPGPLPRIRDEVRKRWPNLDFAFGSIDALVAAIPIWWAAILLAKRRKRLPTGEVAEANLLLRRAAVWCMLAPSFYLVTAPTALQRLGPYVDVQFRSALQALNGRPFAGSFDLNIILQCLLALAFMALMLLARAFIAVIPITRKAVWPGLLARALATDFAMVGLLAITWFLATIRPGPPANWAQNTPWLQVLGPATGALFIALLLTGTLRFTYKIWGKPVVPKWAWFAIIPITTVACFPLSASLTGQGGIYDYWPLFNFLHDVSQYLPAGIAIWLLLRKPVKRLSDTPNEIVLGLYLFAAHIIGTDDTFLFLPVPFLIALPLWKYLVYPAAKRSALATVSPRTIENREELLSIANRLYYAWRLTDSVEACEKKVQSGDLKHGDYLKRKVEAEKILAQSLDDNKFANADGTPISPDVPLDPRRNYLAARDLLFAIPPYPERAANAKRALSKGVWLLIGPIALYFYGLVTQPRDWQSAFALPSELAGLAMMIFWYLLGAFTLGYFFLFIRGTSGMRKGAMLATAIAIATLPFDLLNQWGTPRVFDTFVTVVVQYLYFMALGIWAFDNIVIRKALGDRFRWRTYAKLSGAGAVLAFTSVLGASLTVAVTSFASSQVAAVLGGFARSYTDTSQKSPAAPSSTPAGADVAKK